MLWGNAPLSHFVIHHYPLKVRIRQLKPNPLRPKKHMSPTTSQLELTPSAVSPPNITHISKQIPSHQISPNSDTTCSSSMAICHQILMEPSIYQLLKPVPTSQLSIPILSPLTQIHLQLFLSQVSLPRTL